MRVSVLRGAGDLVVEDRPAPVPGPHEVLVRVASVGVCGSDVHYFEHGRIGSYTVERVEGDRVTLADRLHPSRTKTISAKTLRGDYERMER